MTCRATAEALQALLDALLGRDLVIVAGGLGLAPLRPALYQLFAERARYGKITLLFGARSPAEPVSS
jgi:NAD(P)H-flavin reductase